MGLAKVSMLRNLFFGRGTGSKCPGGRSRLKTKKRNVFSWNLFVSHLNVAICYVFMLSMRSSVSNGNLG